MSNADARPGRLITVFRSYRRPEAEASYAEMAAATDAVVATMPGFVEAKTFTADDGEHVTIVIFESVESQAGWKAEPIHREAQELGRTEFFSAFDLTVAEIRSRRQWSRKEQPAP